MVRFRILIGFSHHANLFHPRAENNNCNLLQCFVGVPFPSQEGGNHNASEVSSSARPFLLFVEIEAEPAGDRHVTREEVARRRVLARINCHTC
jgi:hypothetical protein